MTEEEKPQVMTPKGAKTCTSPVCILSTPFGLATYSIGLLIVLWMEYPYNMLGFLTIAAGFAYTYLISTRH